MQDKRVPHNVQLAAARDLLDRAGLAAGQEITLKLPAYMESIEGILVDVAEAEVVDSPPAALPPGEMDDEDDPLQTVDHSDVVRSREKRATSSSTSAPSSARQSRVRRG